MCGTTLLFTDSSLRLLHVFNVLFDTRFTVLFTVPFLLLRHFLLYRFYFYWAFYCTFYCTELFYCTVYCTALLYFLLYLLGRLDGRRLFHELYLCLLKYLDIASSPLSNTHDLHYSQRYVVILFSCIVCVLLASLLLSSTIACSSHTDSWLSSLALLWFVDGPLLLSSTVACIILTVLWSGLAFFIV